MDVPQPDAEPPSNGRQELDMHRTTNVPCTVGGPGVLDRAPRLSTIVFTNVPSARYWSPSRVTESRPLGRPLESRRPLIA